MTNNERLWRLDLQVRDEGRPCQIAVCRAELLVAGVNPVYEQPNPDFFHGSSMLNLVNPRQSVTGLENCPFSSMNFLLTPPIQWFSHCFPMKIPTLRGLPLPSAASVAGRRARPRGACASAGSCKSLVRCRFNGEKTYVLRVIPTLTPFWHSFWLWKYFWQSDILSGSLSGILFWHSVWHLFWHSVWQSLWHVRVQACPTASGTGAMVFKTKVYRISIWEWFLNRTGHQGLPQIAAFPVQRSNSIWRNRTKLN